MLNASLAQATRVFGLLVDTQRPPALQDSEGHRRDEARPSNDAQDHDEVHRKAWKGVQKAPVSTPLPVPASPSDRQLVLSPFCMQLKPLQPW